MPNILICGRREEGKSTLALHLARQRHSGVVVFDPRGMFDGHLVWSADELEDAIDDRLWKDGKPIVYRFDSEDVEFEFHQVSDILFPPRFTKGAFCLIVDEASYLQTANGIDPKLKRAIGQHPTMPAERSVTIIQTAHRLAEFNGQCKTLYDELFIFGTKNKNDLKALEDHTGEPELQSIVPKLPRHHCVRYIYARQGGEESQYEIWDNPEMWYVQIGANHHGK